MLVIRFKPMGRKHAKHYRISVSQKTRHVTKKSHEDIGWYNPYTKENNINQERLTHYINLNIEISNSVRSLLIKLGHIKKDEKVILETKTPKKTTKK